jgi:hypothetical protein
LRNIFPPEQQEDDDADFSIAETEANATGNGYGQPLLEDFFLLILDEKFCKEP